MQFKKLKEFRKRLIRVVKGKKRKKKGTDYHKFKIRTVPEILNRLTFLYGLVAKTEKKILSEKGEAAGLRRFLENIQYSVGQLEWLLYMRDDSGNWIAETEENEWRV